MNTALQLVLGLQQIDMLHVRHGDQVPLVPLTNLPTQLLSEMVPAASNEIVLRLQSLATSEPAIPQTIMELRRIAEQIAQATSADLQHNAQLEAVAQHVQTIAAINQDAVDGQHTIRQMQIDLANSPLMRYVQEWHIQSATPPTNAVICHVSDQTGEYRVRLRGLTYIERRAALRYTPHDPHPFVEVRALTATPTESMPSERQVWQQRPLPADDLAIYTEQERYKGRIMTRRMDLPLVVDGEPVRITLAAGEHAHVVATDFLDENDRLLVRVIRWPPATS